MLVSSSANVDKTFLIIFCKCRREEKFYGRARMTVIHRGEKGPNGRHRMGRVMCSFQ